MSCNEIIHGIFYNFDAPDKNQIAFVSSRLIR